PRSPSRASPRARRAAVDGRRSLWIDGLVEAALGLRAISVRNTHGVGSAGSSSSGRVAAASASSKPMKASSLTLEATPPPRIDQPYSSSQAPCRSRTLARAGAAAASNRSVAVLGFDRGEGGLEVAGLGRLAGGDQLRI